jgi:Universal stress protein family
MDRIDEYQRKARSAGVISVSNKILVEVGKSEVQMIAEHADMIKADMIFMGSRGLGTFKRLVLGSIASYAVFRRFMASSFGHKPSEASFSDRQRGNESPWNCNLNRHCCIREGK